MRKEIKLLIILPLMALFLGACTNYKVNEYVSSDGFIILEHEIDFEEFMKSRPTEAMSAAELQVYQDAIEKTEAGEWIGYDICEDFFDEQQGNEDYISLGCQPKIYGAKMISILRADVAGEVINEADFYTYNITGLIDLLDLFGNTGDPGNRDTPSLDDLKVEFNIFLEGDIIHSDIGEIDNNKLTINNEQSKSISEGNQYFAKAKKTTVNKIDRERIMNYKINLDGSGYQEIMLVNLASLEPSKQWGATNESIKAAYCSQYEADECFIKDNIIFFRQEMAKSSLMPESIAGSEEYRLNIIEALSFRSLTDDNKKSWLSNNESILLTTIILPGKIIQADLGVINDNQLTIKTEDLAKFKYDSAIVFSVSSKSQEQTKVEVTDEAKIKSIKGPLLNNLTGQILLRVEENGEAYYINPVNQNIFYLGRPADAFRVMREQGLGITNSNLAKIPIAISTLKGQDSDGDGLSDDFELALGLDPHKQDSDGDGHLDMIELANAYNPLGPGRLKYDLNFAKQQAGKILLQVEGRGEAWYLSPKDNKRYFLGRPADAFAVMRSLGLGVANSNFSQIMKFD